MAGILNDSGTSVIARFTAPLSIRSNNPYFVMDTLSLKQITRTYDTQRWEIETGIEPSDTSAEYLIHSVLKGFGTPFLIEMPQVFRRDSSFTTTATSAITTGAGAIGNSSITISGSNGRITKGQFINFGAFSKTYVVTADLIGNGTLNFYPKLINTIANGTVLKYTETAVRMTARYDASSLTGIAFTDGVLSDPGVVKLIEAL